MFGALVGLTLASRMRVRVQHRVLDKLIHAAQPEFAHPAERDAGDRGRQHGEGAEGEPGARAAARRGERETEQRHALVPRRGQHRVLHRFRLPGSFVEVIERLARIGSSAISALRPKSPSCGGSDARRQDRPQAAVQLGERSMNGVLMRNSAPAA